MTLLSVKSRQHDSANRRRCKVRQSLIDLESCHEFAAATHWEAMPHAGATVDATLSAALAFTRNRNKVHGEEMHQSGKGKQWYFGMDADSGLVHTAGGTAANACDVVEACGLLPRQEVDVHGNAGNQVADQRADACPSAWTAIQVTVLLCDPRRSQSCPVPAATRRWPHRALRRQSCTPMPRGQCLSVPVAK